MANLATITTNILADSGIDDINVVVTTGSYTNPAWIVSLPWTKITGTPTTLAGYGIADAYTQTQVNTLLAGYVPYTGATGAVNLGTHSLSANNLTANGGTNAGRLELKNADNASLIRTGYFVLSPSSSNTIIQFGFSTGASTWKNFGFSSHLLPDNTITLFSLPSGGGTIAVVGGAGVGTVTSVAALTLGTSGTDLSSSVANGTTTPVITLNVPTASASNRGALSAADWTTFNNKQNALTNPVTGTSTSGQVAYFNGTSSITGESNLFWDATNDRLGIGSSATPTPVAGVKFPLLVTSDAVTRIRIDSTQATPNAGVGLYANGVQKFSFAMFGATSDFTIYNDALLAFSILVKGDTNNVLIGDSSDVGQRLRVGGRFAFRANATASATTQVPVFVSDPTSTTTELLTRTPAQFRSDIGAQATLTDPVTGTGTAGQVAFWDGTNTQTGSNNLEWDETNRKFDIVSNINSTGFVTTESLRGTENSKLYQVEINSNSNSTSNSGLLLTHTVSANTAQWGLYVNRTGTNLGDLIIRTRTGSLTSAERWRIISSGILQSNGAQTIQTSTGNLTLATAAGNGNIVLSPNGTGISLIENTVVGNIATFKSNTVNGQQLNISSTATGVQIRSLFNTGITGSFDISASGGNSTLSFGTASTERMRITAAGRVLIGTPPPTESTFQLDVNGTSRVSGAATFSSSVTAASGTFITSDTTGTTELLTLSRNASGWGRTVFKQSYNSTFFTNGKTLSLANDSGTDFAHFAGNNAGTITNFILPTGNVGIGTTNPDGTLVVAAGTNGTASTGGYIGLTTGVNNSKVRGAAIDTFTTGSGNDHGLRFYTNEAASSPSVRLTLASTGAATFNTTTAPALDGSANAQILNYNGGNAINELGAGIVFNQRFDAINTSIIRVGGVFGIKTTATGGFGGGLAFYTQPASSANMNLALRLDNTGAATFSSSVTANTGVTINRASLTTSNPLTWTTNGTLDWFFGSSPLGNSTSDLSLYSYGTSSVVFHVAKANGNVGIGTSNLSGFGTQRFLVLGSGAGSQVSRFTDGANADLVFDFPTQGVSRITSQFGTSGSFVFSNGTGFTERMRITSAGRVLIGTPPPAESTFQLDVNGTGRFSGELRTSSVLSFLTNGSVLTRDNGTAQVEVNIRHSSTRNGVLSFTQDAVADRWAIGTKPSDGTLYFSANFDLSTPRLTLTSAGAATFSSTVATTGVVFPTSAVSSADPNTLDDYEEGTWTPGISFGGASVGVTYNSTNEATYTKIGRQVTVTGWLNIALKGSSVGAARITGLPFTTGSFSRYSAASLRCTSITYVGLIQGYAELSSTTIALEELGESGTVTVLRDTDFSNGSSIMISLTYFI